MADRIATIERKTAETSIRLSLNLDGAGRSTIETGVGFLDHMLNLFAVHCRFNLEVKAIGDLHVDDHHTVEDVGICLGSALNSALADRRGIRRYGHFTLPMDETLVTVACDLGNRPSFVWNVAIPVQKIGSFDSELAEEFWKSVAVNGRLNLHALSHYGKNGHHVVEAVFKAAARAIRAAVEYDPRMGDELPTSKQAF
jgi:imidazoleglycerol-phosphate dehydratase